MAITALASMQELESYLTKYEEDIFALSDRIWEIAEIRFEEHQSAKLLISYLKENGFEIETGLGGIETAFVAKYGAKGPIIGILGEYDALPGLNQRGGAAKREAFVKGANGHGCGHNLLGTAGIAAVMVLKEWIAEGKIQGQIHYYGCPAEEGGSGKTFMVREGVFKDVDIALTWHPESYAGVCNRSSLANYQVYFEFEGVAAHAANSPELGRSALDAVELMNVGVNYLREHVPSNVRLHYAVTNTGGISPNVVQANAEVLYLIRGKDIKEVEQIYQRVVKIAEGAALMTETKVKVKFDKACSNYLPNDTINQLLYKNLEAVGLPKYTEQELAYAKQMTQTLTLNEIQAVKNDVKDIAGTYNIDTALDQMDSSFLNIVLPYEQSNKAMAGSTDVADVSWAVPTAQCFTPCFVFGTPLHTWQVVSQGKTSIAHKGLLYAAKVMALTAFDLLQEPKLITKAKLEHAVQTNGSYVNPIPAHVKPNMNK
ncbi:M20 family metallopeptidase [Bacillus ndiopicus]|uniref:M20 family metallopeptidase n=1 Tax=Bacillus ndiopicus TaxID=1347368 RepID=UPI0009DE61EB|nr:M20 family metallopeptidase [Bacillus ndiopicus]